MSDARYWIWLQNVIGIGKSTFDILSYFENAKAVFEADLSVLRESGLFSKAQLERKETVPLFVGDKAISDCKKHGWKIITPDSEFYPPLLKTISDFPLVLYVWGDETVLINKLHIGVIGTRRPSVYGKDVASTMTRELSKAGAVIISGGAQGIDYTAHTSAMLEGGKTILIMGCGFGYDYLMENEKMRMSVTKNGALVSEFPPFTAPTRTSFILRNRITAGICRGVLVIEAGEKSGTLSTAKKSFLYNRDVFVVTGDAKGTSFLGAHELVKYGANVIFSAQDILSLYGYEIRNRESFYFGSFGKGVFEGIEDFPEEGKQTKKDSGKKKKTKAETSEKENKVQKKEYDLSLLSETETAVFEAVRSGKTNLDDMSRMLKIQIRDILIALTNLEIEGLVECNAGNEYTLI